MLESSKQLVLRVHGMDCAEEVAVLRDALTPLLDAELIEFDILNAKMIVDLNQTDVSRQKLMEAVRRTGLKIEMSQERADSMSWPMYKV